MDKHNYFDVNMIIRTDEPMTTLEFDIYLNKLGLSLTGGTIKMAKDYNDEMYKDDEE
jgi:hypothetical protein